MITVKYERTNKKVTPIESNPFIVKALDLRVIMQGHIAIIDTGLKIDMPDNMIPIVAQNKRKDLIVVNVFVDEGTIKLAITPEGEADIYFVKPDEEIALIKLVDISDKHMRFLDWTGQNRCVYNKGKAKL